MELKEYLKEIGYTREQWDKCVDELCKHGVGGGCFQDYQLLMHVLARLHH